MKKIVDSSATTTFLQDLKRYNLPDVFEAIGKLMTIYGYKPTHSFIRGKQDGCNDVEELGFVGDGHSITMKIAKLRSGVRVISKPGVKCDGFVDPKDLPF